MICRWIDRTIAYDGSQLSAHWILSETGIVGDALVAFRGPCSVSRAEIADLADIDGPGIAADDMVHFVWESFSDVDLLLGVHRQRLLSASALEVERRKAGCWKSMVNPTLKPSNGSKRPLRHWRVCPGIAVISTTGMTRQI